jgi:anthranilate/para-aminobenzoate synthase component I
MAKPAILSVLRQMGCQVSESGTIRFSSVFMVDELRNSFGVFAFDGTTATYRMLPLTECDNLIHHFILCSSSSSNYEKGVDNPTFHRDVQTAKEAVRRGEGFAIVISSIVGNDAFTQLNYIVWN